MIYRINNCNGIQAEFANEETEVIDKCTLVTTIQPDGETIQYNHCFLTECLNLWQVDIYKTINHMTINATREIYPDDIRTLMIEPDTPKYTAVLRDNTILQGYYSEQAKKIEKAVRIWTGGFDNE